MKKFTVLLLLLVVATPALARRKSAPPLMPIYIQGDVPNGAAAPSTPKPQSRASYDRRPFNTPPASEIAVTQDTPPPTQRLGLGAELGLASRATDAAGSFGSSQLFLGGRLVARFPIYGETLYLKPSLGFFYKSEGTGTVGITQYVLEGGLVGQWAFAKSGRTRWLLGVANRLDLLWNTTSSFGVSGSSPLFPRYRVGPSVGALFGIGKDLSLSADFEATFSFAPVRPHLSLSAGFLYYW